MDASSRESLVQGMRSKSRAKSAARESISGRVSVSASKTFGLGGEELRGGSMLNTSGSLRPNTAAGKAIKRG